jgi:hypothetical protein
MYFNPTISISLKLLSVLFHLRFELGLSKLKDSVTFVLVVLIPN